MNIPHLLNRDHCVSIIGLSVGAGCGTPQPVCALGSTAAARADGTGCPPPQRREWWVGRFRARDAQVLCYLALAPTASASRRLGGTQATTRDTAPRSPSSLKRGGTQAATCDTAPRSPATHESGGTQLQPCAIAHHGPDTAQRLRHAFCTVSSNPLAAQGWGLYLLWKIDLRNKPVLSCLQCSLGICAFSSTLQAYCTNETSSYPPLCQ